MIALIQRVSSAQVDVEGQTIGKIDNGLLVLLGVEAQDDSQKVKKLADKVMGYRIFSDNDDKMNLNVKQIGGQLLVVSQFTLAAETKKGMRPSFSKGAHPELANHLYEEFLNYCRQSGVETQSGQFAADMKVSLVNDGPVTFWLQV